MLFCHLLRKFIVLFGAFYLLIYLINMFKSPYSLLNACELIN